MFHKKDKILSASDDVAFHMDKILKSFVSGSKICVVVLTPNNIDGSQDFLMTDASLDDVIDAVQRRKVRGNENPSRESGAKVESNAKGLLKELVEWV